MKAYRLLILLAVLLPLMIIGYEFISFDRNYDDLDKPYLKDIRYYTPQSDWDNRTPVEGYLGENGNREERYELLCPGEMWVELVWQDESPEGMTFSNAPDSFTLSILSPTGREIASDRAVNPQGGQGRIRLEANGDHENGTWTLAIDLGQCGDQTGFIRTIEDTGNSYTLSIGYESVSFQKEEKDYQFILDPVGQSSSFRILVIEIVAVLNISFALWLFLMNMKKLKEAKPDKEKRSEILTCITAALFIYFLGLAFLSYGIVMTRNSVREFTLWQFLHLHFNHLTGPLMLIFTMIFFRQKMFDHMKRGKKAFNMVLLGFSIVIAIYIGLQIFVKDLFFSVGYSELRNAIYLDTTPLRSFLENEMYYYSLFISQLLLYIMFIRFRNSRERTLILLIMGAFMASTAGKIFAILRSGVDVHLLFSSQYIYFIPMILWGIITLELFSSRSKRDHCHGKVSRNIPNILFFAFFASMILNFVGSGINYGFSDMHIVRILFVTLTYIPFGFLLYRITSVDNIIGGEDKNERSSTTIYEKIVLYTVWMISLYGIVQVVIMSEESLNIFIRPTEFGFLIIRPLFFAIAICKFNLFSFNIMKKSMGLVFLISLMEICIEIMENTVTFMVPLYLAYFALPEIRFVMNVASRASTNVVTFKLKNWFKNVIKRIFGKEKHVEEEPEPRELPRGSRFARLKRDILRKEFWVSIFLETVILLLAYLFFSGIGLPYVGVLLVFVVVGIHPTINGLVKLFFKPAKVENSS